MMIYLLPLWVILCICSVAICGAIGKSRQLLEIGIWLGILLGPIGIVVILCLDGRPKCPRCANRMDPAATLCTNCGALVARRSHRQPASRITGRPTLPPNWEEQMRQADLNVDQNVDRN